MDDNIKWGDWVEQFDEAARAIFAAAREAFERFAEVLRETAVPIAEAMAAFAALADAGRRSLSPDLRAWLRRPEPLYQCVHNGRPSLSPDLRAWLRRRASYGGTTVVSALRVNNRRAWAMRL